MKKEKKKKNRQSENIKKRKKKNVDHGIRTSHEKLNILGKDIGVRNKEINYEHEEDLDNFFVKRK
jgi:hypothetical protein